MQDMEESEIETRIRILEDIEIPHVRNEYNKALHEFLDAGCFPTPDMHVKVDDAKNVYMKMLSELEDLRNLLSYIGMEDC